jgi:hypothetical protein
VDKSATVLFPTSPFSTTPQADPLKLFKATRPQTVPWAFALPPRLPLVAGFWTLNLDQAEKGVDF